MEEAHPIPQNVTSFEFKLVGDMTLKQFIYLAIGAAIAYAIFVLFASSQPFIAWPLIAIFALLGTAFAFLPYQNRPLDHWVGAFFKAIYSPTKRVWKKNGKSYKEDPNFIKRLSLYKNTPQTSFTQTVTPPVATQQPTTTPVLPTPPSQIPSQQELAKTVDLAKQAQAIQLKIIETERQLSALKTQSQDPGINPQNYTAQVNTVLENLQKLMNEASNIKSQIAKTNNQSEEPREIPKVTIVTPTKSKPTQISLTSSPNVINGIVTDPAGNYLEAVVVVIYDKEGLPVRALKTNKLGQFTGSTPLPNSTYNIEIEKEGLNFDMLQIELNGTVLPPLTIAAKQPINS